MNDVRLAKFACQLWQSNEELKISSRVATSPFIFLWYAANFRRVARDGKRGMGCFCDASVLNEVQLPKVGDPLSAGSLGQMPEDIYAEDGVDSKPWIIISFPWRNSGLREAGLCLPCKIELLGHVIIH